MEGGGVALPPPPPLHLPLLPLLLLLLLAPPAALAAPAVFSSAGVTLVRVGDGATTFSGAVTAPIFLDDFDAASFTTGGCLGAAASSATFSSTTVATGSCLAGGTGGFAQAGLGLRQRRVDVHVDVPSGPRAPRLRALRGLPGQRLRRRNFDGGPEPPDSRRWRGLHLGEGLRRGNV
jgi:hypothetical protein